MKDAKGGYGAVSVKSIEFLDGSKNVVDPAKITGIKVSTDVPTNPGTPTDPSNPGTTTDPTDPGVTDPGVTDPTNPGDTDPSVTDPTNPGVIDPNNPFAIAAAAKLGVAKISVAGMNVTVSGAKAGAEIAVFSMQGKLVASGKAFAGAQTITVPNKGIYMVRVGNKMSKVAVK